MNMRKIIFCTLFVWLGFVFISPALAYEHEGYLNVNDCRETVPISANSFWNTFNDFTCGYEKNSEGQIYGGTCCRVDTAAFTDKCLRAYCYTKSSTVTCSKNATPDSSGECQCQKGYFENQGSCVQAYCPDHSSLYGQLCACQTGFVLNAQGNSCEPVQCPEGSTYSVDQKSCMCNTGLVFTNRVCVKAETYSLGTFADGAPMISSDRGFLRGTLEDVGNYSSFCQSSNTTCGTFYKFTLDPSDQKKLSFPNTSVSFFYIPQNQNAKITYTDVGKSIQIEADRLAWDPSGFWWVNYNFQVLLGTPEATNGSAWSLEPSPVPVTAQDKSQYNQDSEATTITVLILILGSVIFVFVIKRSKKKPNGFTKKNSGEKPKKLE